MVQAGVLSWNLIKYWDFDVVFVNFLSISLHFDQCWNFCRVFISLARTCFTSHLSMFLHEFLFNDFSWLLLADWYSSQWTFGHLQLCLWFESWLASGIHRYIGINNEGALRLPFVFLVSSCVQSIYCLTLCLALARLEWENWPKDSFV